MASSSSAIFSGTSRFSADFQQVLNRAVAIASLPVQQLPERPLHLTIGIERNFDVDRQLRFAAVRALESRVGRRLGVPEFLCFRFVVASVGLTDSPLPGTFSVDVLDIGAFASSMSGAGLVWFRMLQHRISPRPQHILWMSGQSRLQSARRDRRFWIWLRPSMRIRRTAFARRS